MDALIIKKTEETPAVIMNPEREKFMLVATSWPENAFKFYEPVIQWIENYFSNHPNDETVFEFRLDYFNTSSAKQIAKILKLLVNKKAEHKVVIRWAYEKGDADMRKAGERYATLLQSDFEMVERIKGQIKKD